MHYIHHQQFLYKRAPVSGSSQDQKILELMIVKREEEKAAEKKREAARRAWELQKQRDEAFRTTAELRRRESLVRQRQQKDHPKVGASTLCTAVLCQFVVHTSQ